MSERHEFKAVREDYDHGHFECSCGWRSETIGHYPAGIYEGYMRDQKLEHLLRVVMETLATK